MPDPYSVASPHPAYQIVAQFHAPGERWVYRVFGPEAAWCGTFRSAAEAVAFVRHSIEPPAAPFATEVSG